MASTVGSSKVTLQFRVAFDTVWGQQVAVTGPGLDLGESDLTRAPRLSCSQEEGAIIWHGQVSAEYASSIEYKYVVVSETGATEEEEPQLRTLMLHESLRDRGLVFLRDSWQVLPSSLISQLLQTEPSSGCLVEMLCTKPCIKKSLGADGLKTECCGEVDVASDAILDTQYCSIGSTICLAAWPCKSGC